jgi:uncharacterized protein (TIGR03437 family)
VVNGVISSVARAATPAGLVIDAFGSLYIADPSAGEIIQQPRTGLPGALGAEAYDLAISKDGYLYAVEPGVVSRISFNGTSVIVAGGGNRAHGDQGAATLARLNRPSGVTADALGNFYIADRDNHRIRRVTPYGIITTVAGNGVAGNNGDGALATSAQLNSPSSVTVDAGGNLYIADTGNRRVRKVTPAGVILPVPSAGLFAPSYALADSSGNVYIADAGNGTIRRVSSNGAVTTLLAGLVSPRGLALDAAGNLYIADAGAARVWRLDPSGHRVSLGEGIWSAPRAIAVDSETGDVFLADSGLERILRVDASGQVTPVAGDGGAALSAQLGSPWDVAIAPGGTLYVADLDHNRIWRLTPRPSAVVEPLRVVDVVNAASLQPGPIAPGMLLVVRGTGLGAADQILFGTIPATILAADDTRLIVQAPPGISAFATVEIDILHNGKTLAQIPSGVAEAAPALFADVSGEASANNEDGTLNSPANPAPRGSMIVLYGTGEGVSGLPVSVRIGNNPAEVLYAGPVAGYPGLLQINARVPAGYAPPGNLSVTIAVGETSSQPGVAIAVN